MGKTTFTRDEANATLTIERSFPANRARVWRALTDPQWLDLWWAPAPWKTHTKHMDFRVGGHWLYAMQGPDEAQHFGRMDYLEIRDGQHYKSQDVFCDAQGKANASLPTQTMTMRLVDGSNENETKLVGFVEYASLEDMNTILEMGMREGLTLAQDQLEALLRSEA